MKELNVWYQGGNSPQLVGQLALYKHRVAFEYHSAFLQTGIELSPFLVPAKPGVLIPESQPWGGLAGLFNDSLPDGWGLLLMDRHLKSLGIDMRKITPLDRLAYIGDRGLGALTYEPVSQENLKPFDIDLTSVARSANEIYEGETSQQLAIISKIGGSPGGARPKVLVHLKGDHLISGDENAPEGYEPWIIKFFAKNESPDTGRIEFAYSLMAKDAGIDMPETRIFEDKDGNTWFGIKRFDRNGAQRIHMHTLGGLVGADFRMPSIDYTDVLKATRELTRNQKDVKQMFKVMVFNVLAKNRDDHSKNFSFLMDADGHWRVSPAYDLTLSKGMAGEHTTSIAGEGIHPTKEHMLKVGEQVDLSLKDMNSIIGKVEAAVAQWTKWCKKTGVKSAPNILG